jgi:hypothetical protein
LTRLFAEHAEHDFSGFRPGCVVTVRITPGADLRLPTGRLVAGEPWAGFGGEAEKYAFVQQVPPGFYPVQLIMADFYDPENPQGNTNFSVVAAARLTVRDTPVAVWRMALQPGQDDAVLAEDEFFGYPVDGGTGSFGSPEIFNTLSEKDEPEEIFDHFTDIIESHDMGVYVDEVTGNNLVMFPSGDGDGRYGTWVGYTADDEVASFVTDFMTLTYHADEDECRYCAAGPRGPQPAPSPGRGDA